MIMYFNTRLYAATFENLRNDNKKFRAKNDFTAMNRAVKISEANGYGKVLRIYELHERTFRIKRAALNFKRVATPPVNSVDTPLASEWGFAKERRAREV